MAQRDSGCATAVESESRERAAIPAPHGGTPVPILDSRTLAICLKNASATLAQLSRESQTGARELAGTVRLLDQISFNLLEDRAIPAQGGDLAGLTQAAIQEAEAIAAAEAVFMAWQSQLAMRESASARAFDARRLEAYLREHPLGGPETCVRSAAQVPGGRTKQTVLIEQTGARALPLRFIIRQDWAAGVTATTVTDEYPLLAALADTAVPSPEPLLHEPSDILASPFIAVEWMRGQSAGDMFSPPLRADLALDFAAHLAALHAIPVEAFAACPLRREHGSAAELRAEIEAVGEELQALAPPSRVVDCALIWLRRNASSSVGSSLLHNDLGFHNFLFEDGRITGILDWELASIGDPAADLGYCRAFVEKMIPWADFLAAYGAAGGPAVSGDAVRFFSLWTMVRVYRLVVRSAAAIADGRIRDHEITVTVGASVPLLLQCIARHLLECLDHAPLERQ
ncbi:Predicted kinase, aminoglycoside phosphotransferase (APT) family [Sphingobium faniae]|nr:Predicted kinase, aminoglycoside phosphotransferase (APT) family [Sphingobium faniae]